MFEGELGVPKSEHRAALQRIIELQAQLDEERRIGEFLYTDVKDYESCLGSIVGAAFKIGWVMARTRKAALEVMDE